MLTKIARTILTKIATFYTEIYDKKNSSVSLLVIKINLHNLFTPRYTSS